MLLSIVPDTRRHVSLISDVDGSIPGPLVETHVWVNCVVVGGIPGSEVVSVVEVHVCKLSLTDRRGSSCVYESVTVEQFWVVSWLKVEAAGTELSSVTSVSVTDQQNELLSVTVIKGVPGSWLVCVDVLQIESETVVAAVSVVVTVAEIQVWLSTVVVTGGSLPSVVEAVLTVQVLLIVLSVSVDGLFSTYTVVTMETV